MWSLWPLLHSAYNDWAMDYLDNILVPLDNFISKGTEVFLACKSPDYLAQVCTTCSCTPSCCTDTSLYRKEAELT